MPIGDVFSCHNFLHPLTISSEEAEALENRSNGVDKSNPPVKSEFWKDKQVTLSFSVVDFLLSVFGIIYPLYMYLSQQRKMEATKRFKEIYNVLDKGFETEQKTSEVANKILNKGLVGNDSYNLIEDAYNRNDMQSALDIFQVTREVFDISGTITQSGSLRMAQQLLAKAAELKLIPDGQTPLFLLLNQPKNLVNLKYQIGMKVPVKYIDVTQQKDRFATVYDPVNLKKINEFKTWIDECNPINTDGDSFNMLHFVQSWKNETDVREGIDLLLCLGANINCQDPVDGFTPLHRASGTGNLFAVQYLLGKKADTTLISNYAKRPAMQAALDGKLSKEEKDKVIEQLVNSPEVNPQRLNLIHMAIRDKAPETSKEIKARNTEEARLERLEKLKEYGFASFEDINHLDVHERSPFDIAVEQKDWKIAAWLIENNSAFDSGRYKELKDQKVNEVLDVLHAMYPGLSETNDVMLWYYSPIHAALASNLEFERLKKVVSENAKSVYTTDFIYRSAIHLAIPKGKAYVDLLLQAGSPVEFAFGKNLVVEAYLAEKYDIVELLLKDGLNKHKRNLLQHVIVDNDLQEVTKLRLLNQIITNDKKALEHVDSEDCSAIHLAAMKNSPNMIKLLVAAGCNVEGNSKSVVTPLGLALEQAVRVDHTNKPRNDWRAVKALLQAGANPEKAHNPRTGKSFALTIKESGETLESLKAS